jgi:hypothetical protein
MIIIIVSMRSEALECNVREVNKSGQCLVSIGMQCNVIKLMDCFTDNQHSHEPIDSCSIIGCMAMISDMI